MDATSHTLVPIVFNFYATANKLIINVCTKEVPSHNVSVSDPSFI